MPTCPFPECGRALEGLARFCHSCKRYVDDYRREEPKAARALPDDPRSEKEIQTGVKNALAAMGFGIWDTSQPFAAKITPGVADLFVAGRGACAWIECKSSTGRQSEAQAAFQVAVESNEGTYILARHERDVIAWAEGLPAIRRAG